MQHTLSKSFDYKPLKILQISDLHLLPAPGEKLLGIDTGLYFNRVLELALQEHQQADLILLTGDLAQIPQMSSYRQILSVLEDVNIPAVCLPGNHDDYVLMQNIFCEKKIACNKQTLYDNWHIICLNSKKPHSPGGHLEAEELKRLENYLQIYPQHHTLIAMHHPCCAIGSRWLDAQKIDNGEALLQLLARFPQVKAITTGHVHQEINLSVNGLKIYSTPSTCFQFTPGSDEFAINKTAPGYRWFNLHHNGNIESGVSRLPGRLDELHYESQGY